MSALAGHLDDYLALRRALGHELADAARLLPRFVGYLDEIGADTVTIEAALVWSQQPEAAPGTTVWARRMTAVRGFARYLSGIDPNTEVPPLGTVSYWRRWRPPFVYSPADIEALMDHARQSIPSPLRSATLETLIGLLAVTGMRVGETLRLDRSDLDWDEGVALVRMSKFGKTRQVPLQTSSLEALAAYAQIRDQLHPHPQDPSFFLSNVGKRVIYQVVQDVFRSLVQQSGVGAGSAFRPRLHDFRHTFAVRTLLGWHRSGRDVEALLPSLATYLGHRDPRSTYWYLSAAPELLAVAAGRLEAAETVA